MKVCNADKMSPICFALKQKLNSWPSQSVGTGFYPKSHYKYTVGKTKLSWREQGQLAVLLYSKSNSRENQKKGWAKSGDMNEMQAVVGM